MPEPGVVEFFVSYTEKDRAEAEELVAELEARGVQCWHMFGKRSSGRWSQEVSAAVQRSAVLVIMYSRHTPASSGQACLDELELARQYNVPAVQIRLDKSKLADGFDTYLGGLTPVEWTSASEVAGQVIARHEHSSTGLPKRTAARGARKVWAAAVAILLIAATAIALNRGQEVPQARARGPASTAASPPASGTQGLSWTSAQPTASVAGVQVSAGTANVTDGATDWRPDTVANYDDVVGAQLVIGASGRQPAVTPTLLLSDDADTTHHIGWRVVVGDSAVNVAVPIEVDRADATLALIPESVTWRHLDRTGARYLTQRLPDADVLAPSHPLDTVPNQNGGISVKALFRVMVSGTTVDLVRKTEGDSGSATTYARAGVPIQAELVVKNTGNTNQYGVSASVRLPEGIRFRRAQGARTVRTPGQQAVASWPGRTLEPGETHRYEVTLVPISGDLLRLLAEVRLTERGSSRLHWNTMDVYLET